MALKIFLYISGKYDISKNVSCHIVIKKKEKKKKKEAS